MSNSLKYLENIFDQVGTDNVDPLIWAALQKLVENGLIVRDENGLWQVTDRGLSELGEISLEGKQ
jgi:uncharacterized protein with von Willebrand factor type A (vWA) domain